MTRAHKRASSALPGMKPCRSLKLTEGDVFIAAGGFEDRMFASLECLVARNGARAIVLKYLPFDAGNRDSELVARLGGAGVRVHKDDMLMYDRFEPHGFPEVLRAALLRLNSKRVVVDISAMSKLAILLTLDVCRELAVSVSVFYCEAKEYGPTQEEYEQARSESNVHRPSIQVYTGVHGVVGNSRLASVAMQGQPLAAIAFMSFNECLTQALINSVYPSRLFLINGRPPKLSWREDATAWIHDQLRLEWPREDNPVLLSGSREVPERTTSTLHYQESVRLLLKLYWELCPDHRLLLAPTGSKMQTVACYFVKAVHPDIHIEYPTPEGFLSLYSRGVGAKHILHFGVLKQLVERFAKQERASHLAMPVARVDEAHRQDDWP